MTVSVSGFVVSDCIVLCAGAVFSKFDFIVGVVAQFDDDFWIQIKHSSCVQVLSLKRYVQFLTNRFSEEWRVGWDDDGTSFSKVAILKLGDMTSIRPAYFLSTKNLACGDTVRIISSPFGSLCHSVFRNSVTRGCVFNKADVLGVMALDTRCLPGSEGAVLLDQDGFAVGMQVVFIYRSRDSVAISIGVISSILLQLLQKNNIKRVLISSPRCHMSVYDTCERYLVCIRICHSWCTAIIVHSNGYLLTNAHLFLPYMKSGIINEPIFVQIRSCNFRDGSTTSVQLVASLIYRSQGPWDVALVRINETRKLFTVMDGAGLSEASVGMNVLVVGYGIFHPDNGRERTQFIKPSSSQGMVSKVVASGGRAIMVQSSAMVHSGNSGGALIDARTGALLGIVTSNTRQQKRDLGSIIIPRLNFSIPEWVVAKCIEYAQSSDEQILQNLNDPDDAVSQIWSLSICEASDTKSKL